MRRRRHYFELEPGAPASIAVRTARRLRFSEVDALAIAWHGRYLSFFEEAHTELMRAVDLTYENYRRCDIGAPMVQSHVDYFQSLELDELFTVEARLFWSDGARLNVEYAVTGEKGLLAASGFTVQMFVGLKNREPFVVDPDIYAAMKQRWRAGAFESLK